MSEPVTLLCYIAGRSRRHSEHDEISNSTCSPGPANAVTAAAALATATAGLLPTSASQSRALRSLGKPELSDRSSLTGGGPAAPGALTPVAAAGDVAMALDGYGTFEYTSFRDEEDSEQSKDGSTPTRAAGKSTRGSRTARASGSLSPPGSGSTLSDASSVQMRAAAVMSAGAASVSRATDAPVKSGSGIAETARKLANGAITTTTAAAAKTRATSREASTRPAAGNASRGDAVPAASRPDREKAVTGGAVTNEVLVESASQPLLVDADGPEDAFDDSEADSASWLSTSEILLQSRLNRQYHFATNASFDADTVPAPQFSATNPFTAAPPASNADAASSRVSAATDPLSDSVFSAAPVTNALLQRSITARSGAPRGPRESTSGLSDVVLVCGALPNSQSFTSATRFSAASVTPPPLDPPPPTIPRRSKRRSEMTSDSRRVSGVPLADAAAALADAANRRADSPALSQLGDQTSETNASDSGSAKGKWIDFSESPNPNPNHKTALSSSSRSSMTAQQPLVTTASAAAQPFVPPVPAPAPAPAPVPPVPASSRQQSLPQARHVRREMSREFVGTAWEPFPSDRAPLDLDGDACACDRPEVLHVRPSPAAPSPSASDSAARRSASGMGAQSQSQSLVARKPAPRDREGIPNLTFREEPSSGRSPLTPARHNSGAGAGGVAAAAVASASRISTSQSLYALTNPFFDNSTSAPRVSEPSPTPAPPARVSMPMHQIPILPGPPSNKTRASNASANKQMGASAAAASASTPNGEQPATGGGIIALLRTKLRLKNSDAQPAPTPVVC